MNKLKEVRGKKGMTRSELARRSGVNAKLLWEYETDKRDPNLATLRKIAEALGVKIQDIVW